MQIITDKIKEILSPLLSKYNQFNPREKKLINLLLISTLFIFLYILVSSILNTINNNSKNSIRSKEQLVTLQESLIRLSSLKKKKEELTSKYLNSSMSYEQLTNHLDQLIKKQVKDAKYELTPSKDITEIGTEFIARKFSLSVKELSSISLPKLLQALESGPPPLLLQRVEVTKLNNDSLISLSLDLLTIEKYSEDKVNLK